MNKYLLFFLIFVLTSFENANSKSENFIVAKVGKKIITNLDVKNKILTTLIIANEDINQDNINNSKKQTFQNLITLRLKEIELEKFDYSISEQRMNSFLNQVSGNNIESLITKFRDFNVDYEIFKKEIEVEIKWRQFIYQKYSKKISVNQEAIDTEIKNVLNSNISGSKELNLSEIVVPQEENISNEIIISKITNEIKKNGFDNTALKFSISSSSTEKGNLGWIDSRALSSKIIDKIKNLEVNQISKPIIDTNSILFLKLNDQRIIKKNLDVEKLRNNIIKQKQNEMFNLYSESHLSKLKNRNLIEYNE